MTTDFDRITFGEVELLLDLFQQASVRAVARHLQLSPSQVSRSLRGVEEKLGIVLFRSSPQGLLPTPEGRSLVPQLENVRAARRLLAARVHGAAPGGPVRTPLSIGSVSFVTTHVVAPAVSALEGEQGSRGPYVLLDFPPDALVQAGLNNAFDACCHLGDLEWPRSWDTVPVAEVRWHLVARAENAVEARVEEDVVARLPFVLPGYWSPWGLQSGNDFCPLPLEARVRFATTATAEAALQIVSRTDAVAFLPEVLTRDAVKAGVLRVVEVDGWAPVSRPLHLTVREAAVSKRARDGLALTLRARVEGNCTR